MTANAIPCQSFIVNGCKGVNGKGCSYMSSSSLSFPDGFSPLLKMAIKLLREPYPEDTV